MDSIRDTYWAYFPLSIVMPAVALWFAGRWLFGAWIFWRLYAEAGMRPSQDVSELIPVLPARALPVVESLYALSFSRLGEVQVKVPGARQPSTIWLYVSEDRASWIEIAVFGKEVTTVLQTPFPDESLVETWYPGGVNLRSADYVSHRVRKSVEAAYEHHRQQVETWRESHRSPDRIESMADFLRWEPILADRFTRRRLRGAFFRRVLPAGVLIGALLIASFLGPILLDRLDISMLVSLLCYVSLVVGSVVLMWLNGRR